MSSLFHGAGTRTSCSASRFQLMCDASPLLIPFAGFGTDPVKKTANFSCSLQFLQFRSPFRPLQCSMLFSQRTPVTHSMKPSSADACRTILEGSSTGTLSSRTQEGWPLGVGVRFMVDSQGTPVVCLNTGLREFGYDRRCSLHVQLEHFGFRTPQCTLLGNLQRPDDKNFLKELHELWLRRFVEDVNEDHIHMIHTDCLLYMEDYQKDGIWVSSLEYVKAEPDPLRGCAEKIVNEMNANHMEDVCRICNIFTDLKFQVVEAEMIWVDRMGFDILLRSSQNDAYEIRIPFPVEVADEKLARSSLSCLAQLAWEVERNYAVPNFEKVKHLKRVTLSGDTR